MSARLNSALHNPIQEQEVRAAVESVFPFSLLAQFLTSPSSEKELQLNELPYIVSGICLFNKCTGASGAGASVAALQEHATDPDQTLERCVEQLKSVRHRLILYSGPVFHQSCLVTTFSAIALVHVGPPAHSCTSAIFLAEPPAFVNFGVAVDEDKMMLQLMYLPFDRQESCR